MYTFQSRIRYSEVGTDGKLTLNSLLDYFQDCSTFHSEDIGLGVDYLKERNMAWLLSSWQIVVARYPNLCENVIIGTSPYEFKAFMGYRNFLMQTESGERLAYANSIWSLMDMEKMIPAKPPKEMLEGYVLSEKLPMDYAPRKIAIPEGGMQNEAINVGVHNLDTNGHMNNGQHVRMAMQYIPKNFHIAQMRAEYKKQALLGDIIIPVVSVDMKETLYTVVLGAEDGAPYSIVEFTGKKEA
ncbi:MAG: acyl-[acyl-carrier-protein] thioesterase [Lachnospiraceae bacterium]|nr:acyl-[acyl-carrier-protein] thioesterase [Lachnospiraceae bacterium]